MTGHPPPLLLLLVDDAPELRALLRAILGDRPDLRIEDAASGEEALEMAVRETPWMVVMDQNMGALNGVATTQRLRALCADIEIVAFTAVPGAERDFALAGAPRHFLKDRFADLVAYIEQRAAAAVAESEAA